MKRRLFLKRTTPALGLLMFPHLLKAKAQKELPNVLILGDSISIGYTPFVQEQMKGIAKVVRPLRENGSNENCQGTTNGVKHIDRWLGDTQWDIIHFNFGLHDLKRVDPETGKNSMKPEDPYQANLKQYKNQLRTIVKKLKKTKAILIFATTTPYPDVPAGPLRTADLPEKYNRVALKIMKKNDILVNDLHRFVIPRMKELQIPNNVHFTKEGSKVLAKEVVSFIHKILNK